MKYQILQSLFVFFFLTSGYSTQNLSEYLIKGKFKEGDQIIISVKDTDLVMTRKQKKVKEEIGAGKTGCVEKD